MFFRIIYIIKPIDLGRQEKNFEVTDPPDKWKIHFRRLEIDELNSSYKKGDVESTITIFKKISEKRIVLFEDLENLPSRLTPFLGEVKSELSEFTERAVKLFRWMRGDASPQNPIRYFKSFEISRDCQQWFLVPSTISMHVRFGLPIEQKLSEEFKVNFAEAIAKGIYEPLGHDLFSEAWYLNTGDFKSCIIMAVAAVETGFKHCVSALIPEATWLVSEVASPPVHRMLQEYLPQLPAKLKINHKVLAPPPSILQTIQKGITIRNDLVHGKSVRLSYETVNKTLRAVYDVLYLLDFYCGHKWAWNRISINTSRELMQISSEKK